MLVRNDWREAWPGLGKASEDLTRQAARAAELRGELGESFSSPQAWPFRACRRCDSSGPTAGVACAFPNARGAPEACLNLDQAGHLGCAAIYEIQSTRPKDVARL